jgi:tetratricopeptide (TPR) repeat protein
LNNSKISEIERLRKNKDCEEAIRICSDVIAEDHDAYAVYSKRSYIFRELGRFPEALADLARLTELRPGDPTAYLQRAEWQLELGEDSLALKDIEFVISTNEHYYMDTANFYKAIALLSMDDKLAAAAACLRLPRDFKYHIVTPSLGSRIMTWDELYTMTQRSR